MKLSSSLGRRSHNKRLLSHDVSPSFERHIAIFSRDYRICALASAKLIKSDIHVQARVVDELVA